MNKHEKILKITWLAFLSALVIVLQLVGGSIKLGPVSLNFTLVPIVVGTIMLGPLDGAFLGFIAGFINVLNGLLGVDPFTAQLIEYAPFWTIFICILKTTLAGLVPGLLYKYFYKDKKIGIIITCLLVPIINTLIFVIGTYLFLYDAVIKASGTEDVFYFLIVICAGWNFICELGVNCICTPAVLTIKKAIENRHK